MTVKTPPLKTGEERRAYPATALRAVGAKGSAPKLVGYAARFSSGPTDNLSEDLGGFRERIQAGFFKKALANNPDVRFLTNHAGLPLARTSNGSLDLWEDSTGLAFEARLDPADPDVQALLPKVAAGLVSQMSFAFRLPEKGGDRWEDTPNGPLRTLVTCSEITDVSAVTYPAYLSSSVQARRLREEAARVHRPLTAAECRRRMAEQDARLGLRLPARSGYATVATLSPERQALLELRARRERLERKYAGDPYAAHRLKLAQQRQARQRAEGAGFGPAIRGLDGHLRAAE